MKKSSFLLLSNFYYLIVNFSLKYIRKGHFVKKDFVIARKLYRERIQNPEAGSQNLFSIPKELYWEGHKKQKIFC